jgi:hypothetical protein
MFTEAYNSREQKKIQTRIINIRSDLHNKHFMIRTDDHRELIPLLIHEESIGHSSYPYLTGTRSGQKSVGPPTDDSTRASIHQCHFVQYIKIKQARRNAPQCIPHCSHPEFSSRLQQLTYNAVSDIKS